MDDLTFEQQIFLSVLPSVLKALGAEHAGFDLREGSEHALMTQAYCFSVDVAENFNVFVLEDAKLNFMSKNKEKDPS